MTNLPPSRTADRIIIRLPDGMREKLRSRAEANGRSMTAEVVATLSLALGDVEAQKLDELREQLAMLDTRMRHTAAELDDIAQRKSHLLTEIAVRERMMGANDAD